MEDENSKSMISRVTYPETHKGIQALWILSFIWMQITAPMKKDMSRTIAIELSPNCIISFRYCLKNIRILSGQEKTRPIKNRYWPNACRNLVIYILVIWLEFHYREKERFLLVLAIWSVFKTSPNACLKRSSYNVWESIWSWNVFMSDFLVISVASGNLSSYHFSKHSSAIFFIWILPAERPLL